jgi:hypothetical protein
VHHQKLLNIAHPPVPHAPSGSTQPLSILRVFLHVQAGEDVTVIELPELMASFGGEWCLWEKRHSIGRVVKIASWKSYLNYPAYAGLQVRHRSSGRAHAPRAPSVQLTTTRFCHLLMQAW